MNRMWLLILGFFLSMAGLAVAGVGILLMDVDPEGPAARAGLTGGDQLVKLGDRDIRSLPDLESALESHEPGEQVPVTVVREGTPREVVLTLGGLPGQTPRLGVMLDPASLSSGDAGREMSQDERREILRRMADALRQGYLYEDKGRDWAQQLQEAADTDLFAEATDRGAFIRQVNQYLLALSRDKHLRLTFGAPLHDEDGDRRQRSVVRRPGKQTAASPSAAASASGSHGETTPAAGPKMSFSYGFADARVLEGNVGYVDLRMFAGSEAARGKVDEVMLSLQDVDALILDLGRNGGGGPWMVRYLSGFLFAEPTHLANTWFRGMETPAERWTLDGQPTTAFHDKPVFILTSPRTFSAAESFTFGLKSRDRVTLIGEQTGGGGHFGHGVEVAEDLSLFVPRGRTFNPETGEGWEAEGISPDIPVPYEEALERALQEATRRSRQSGR